ncbi:MAG: IS110 family transposase [Candidatus Thorarchaeota archaeon]|nr:IS110 family transposase [Candidatus Thorarchaeota archaeon]
METNSLKYCGIDVSKTDLVCAVIGDLEQQHRQFLPGQSADLGIVGSEPVMTKSFVNSWSGVIAMTRWMQSVGISMAVMESTGIYWYATFAALETAGIKAILANARQVKNVSTHKSDLKDCVWLAVLLRAGFIIPSYVPAGLIKDLREATRMRTTITRDNTRLKNRCHKILDSVLVNLGMSTTFGKRGRAVLIRALKGNYKDLDEEQRCAFASVSDIQQLMLVDLLTSIEFNEKRIDRYEAAIAALVERLEEEQSDRDITLLVTVPGVGLVSAAALKAEIGTVERFSTPERFASYAGLAPRLMQSGEKRTTGRIVRRSNSHLRTTMYLVAQSCAIHGPEKLKKFHQRVRGKKGYKVATVALARKLMVVMWKMLKEQLTFEMANRDGLAERKRRVMRANLRKLKKLENRYGTEEAFVAIQEVMQRKKLSANSMT